jgi:hypothetical protein
MMVKCGTPSGYNHRVTTGIRMEELTPERSQREVMYRMEMAWVWQNWKWHGCGKTANPLFKNKIAGSTSEVDHLLDFSILENGPIVHFWWLVVRYGSHTADYEGVFGG